MGGRTRALALYFFRIVVTFILFYGPMAILAFIKNAYPVESYGSASYFLIMSAFSTLNPIQNIVTIHFLLQKNDIQAAMHKLVHRVSALPIVSFGRRSTNSAGQHNAWEMDDTYERPTTTE